MPKKKILQKGEYENNVSILPVIPKQYIILEGEDTNKLVLRFENLRDNKLTSICINIVQYSSGGKVISEKKTELDVKAPGKALFTPEKEFDLKKGCTDFKVHMLKATYGSFVYEARNNELVTSYKKPDDQKKKFFDRTAMYSEMGEKKNTLSVRTLRSPFMMIPLVLLLLLAVSAVSYYLASNYTNTHFTLDGIQYRFTTDNIEDGPVEIIGYSGRNKDVVINKHIEGHEITAIREGSFRYSNIRNLTVNGDIPIESYAFSHSTVKTLTLNGVSSIGSYAFSNCSNLESADIGDSVTRLGEGIFSSCYALTSVSYTPASDELDYIPSCMFENCAALSEFTIPLNTEEIGSRAFFGCFSLAEIALPQNVKSIGISAFADCHSLKSIELSKLEVIPERLFENCYALEKISVQNGAAAVEDFAFSGCSSLKTLALPASISYIGNGIVMNCNAIEDITLPFVGQGVSDNGNSFGSIFNFGFYDEYVPETLKKITVLGGNIGNYAFRSCQNVEEVAIEGNSTYSIGEFAFDCCYSLRRLTLPKGLSVIGSNAFSECHRLSIVINRSELLLSDFEDSGITNRLITCVSDEGDISETSFEGFDMLLGDDGYWHALEYTDSDFDGSILFPEAFSYRGTLVSEYKIADYFIKTSQKEAIRSVDFSAAVKEIGEFAFADCYSLEKLNYSSEGSLTHINDCAFVNCSALRTVTIPEGIKSIGNDAYLGCGNVLVVFNLSSLPLEKGSIDHGCAAYYAKAVLDKEPVDPKSRTLSGFEFLNIYDLWFLTEAENFSSLDLSDIYYGGAPIENIYILDSAFCGNLSLKTVYIGANIKEVCPSAFSGCTSLSTLRFEDGEYEIGEFAFAGCSGIRSLTVPKGIKSIGELAFDGCEIYEIVNLSSLDITAGSDSHGAIARNAVKVHTDTKDAFSFKTVSTGDASFLFAYDFSGAYLCSISSFDYLSVLVLPSFSIDKEDTYSIHKTAFNKCSYFDSIFIGDFVKEIHKELASYLEYKTLYYGGTAEEFKKSELSSYFFGEVLYYSECVHEYGFWRYDSGGRITTEHTEMNEQEIKAATCTEEGIMKYSCDVCSLNFEAFIPLKAHSLNDPVIIKEPTCKNKGTERTYCSECPYYYDTVIYTVNHVFTEYVITKEATCTDTGIKEASCKWCDTKNGIIVPSLGHNIEGGICTRCGIKETENGNYSKQSPLFNTESNSLSFIPNQKEKLWLTEF